jgi:hypothetical protein
MNIHSLKYLGIFVIIIYELEAPSGTRAITQKIAEDADDEQFLEEGLEDHQN